MNEHPSRLCYYYSAPALNRSTITLQSAAPGDVTEVGSGRERLPVRLRAFQRRRVCDVDSLPSNGPPSADLTPSPGAQRLFFSFLFHALSFLVLFSSLPHAVPIQIPANTVLPLHPSKGSDTHSSAIPTAPARCLEK